MAVLALDRVTKRFDAFTAVDDLSFEAPEGAIFGFLGANGAGKTTTLRMALDILRPTRGTIEVLGHPPGRRGGEVGFLPEERGLYRQMTAQETVVYFGRLKGMSANDAQASARSLLERFGLAPFADHKVEQLSKGMAQKVQLAAALVTGPRLIILDEPFSGLDPVNQAVLEEVVLERRRSDGATVIFSTHVMQHAERLCDRLLLLAKGRKVFQGDQDEARAQLPTRLTLTARDDPRALPGVQQAERLGPAHDGWSDWAITLGPGGDAAGLLEACTTRGFALRRFDIQRTSLHEVFLHLVGDAPATEAAP